MSRLTHLCIAVLTCMPTPIIANEPALGDTPNACVSDQSDPISAGRPAPPIP